MSETADWKQKYRDSLREMEAEEKRWREVEQVLRRLIGRLCAAGMGLEPQLDDELTAPASANRRNAYALLLEKLAESLTIAVVAVDATSPLRRLPASASSRLTASPQVPAPLRVTAQPPHLVASAPRPAATEAHCSRWNSTCDALASLLGRLEAGATDRSALGNLVDELA